MSNFPLKYLLVLIATAAAIRLLASTARRIGLVDNPGGRKRHEGTVPLTGGAVMFAGFIFGALMLLDSLYPYRPLFAAMGIVMVAGILDDLHDLSAGKKILLQIVAALFMTSWGAMNVEHLGNLVGFGPLNLRGWSIPFTVVCVLGIINAINMADGIDGLAGGFAFVATAFLGVSALMLGEPGPARLLFVMLAAVGGFLLFNMRLPWRSRAAVFMGDSGSMMLGMFLTWFSVELTQRETECLPPIVAVWFLAVPILDMSLVTLRRLLKGVSPFRAGRDHLHHVLLLSRWSPARTVNFMLALSVLFASVGLAGWQFGASEASLFYAFVALFGAYYLLSRRAWRLVRVLRKFNSA